MKNEENVVFCGFSEAWSGKLRRGTWQGFYTEYLMSTTWEDEGSNGSQSSQILHST